MEEVVDKKQQIKSTWPLLLDHSPIRQYQLCSAYNLASHYYVLIKLWPFLWSNWDKSQQHQRIELTMFWLDHNHSTYPHTHTHTHTHTRDKNSKVFLIITTNFLPIIKDSVQLHFKEQWTTRLFSGCICWLVLWVHDAWAFAISTLHEWELWVLVFPDLKEELAGQGVPLVLLGEPAYYHC